MAPSSHGRLGRADGRRLGRGAVMLAIVGALLGPVAVGVQGAPAQGITQEQAAAILQELRQIRQLLERNQRPEPPRAAAAAPAPEQRVAVSVDGAYALGRVDAPVTLVEFTDYECPFCRQFHLTAFAQLKRNYIDTGKVRFVSRDLPLPIHRHALGAAHAARCAGEQGKYWEMRHVMIVNANRLDPESVATYARDLTLDAGRFEACMRSDRHGKAIERDIADAQAAGITGTPSFVLGKRSGDGVEGVTIVGAQPYGTFEARIRQLLGSD